MVIDWNAVATLISPVIALGLGIALDKLFRDKAKLISYIRHVSNITLPGNGQQAPVVVNSHSVVIINTGKKPAENVRLVHHTLPNFNVHPDMEWTVKKLPGGGEEIRFPKIIPGKEVVITYLYFPPLTWQQTNSHTESDDGAAKIVNVLPMVPWPNWKIWTMRFLTGYGILGLIASAYWLVSA